MANSTIHDLTAKNILDSADEFVIEDIAGVATKKIDYGKLLNCLRTDLRNIYAAPISVVTSDTTIASTGYFYGVDLTSALANIFIDLPAVGGVPLGKTFIIGDVTGLCGLPYSIKIRTNGTDKINGAGIHTLAAPYHGGILIAMSSTKWYFIKSDYY